MSCTKSTLFRSTRGACLAASIAGPALVGVAPATAATQSVQVSAAPITASLSTEGIPLVEDHDQEHRHAPARSGTRS